MRRLFWAATMLVALAGCRDRYDRTAQGTERPVTDVGRAAPGGPRVGAECVAQDQADTTRVLAIFDVVSQGEVEAAHVAQENGASPDVKQFAQHMIDQHEKNRRDIEQLAKSKKLPLETAESSDPYALAFAAAHRAHMETLRGLHGQELDVAYMRAQPSQHELLAQLAFFAQNASTDSDVRNLLGSTTQELQQHHDMAMHAMPKACAVTTPPAPSTATPEPGTQIQRPGTNPPGSGVGLTPKGGGAEVPAPTGTGREAAPPSQQGAAPQQGAPSGGAQQTPPRSGHQGAPNHVPKGSTGQ